jgi:hypothetical protein
VCELAYLAQMILAGGSYASLRDLADYGATIAFDDAETVMDRKRGDPDKRTLLLAGNRRGSQVTVRELATEKTWRTRYVNTFSPRLFSAIRLPDDVLASRTITIPLVRSIDDHRAKAEPLDHELWPHGRTALIDDLWALALGNLATLKKYDSKAAQDARLSGRNLEPWRAILAVAAWLDSHDDTGKLQQGYQDPEDKDPQAERRGGLFARLEALSVAYQEERSDLEAYDPTRLLIKALQAISDKCLVDPIEFSSGDLTAEMNRLAIADELTDEEEKFTNAQRVGRLLERLRFKKGQRSSTKRRWHVSRDELKAHARAYGMGSLS